MFGWMIAGAGQNPPSGMTSPPGPDAAASLSVTVPLRPGSEASRPGSFPAPCDSIRQFMRDAVTPASPAGAGPGGAARAGLHAEAAADDLLHDLGRAAEDGLCPPVGVGPGHRVLPHVAVAAVELDAP